RDDSISPSSLPGPERLTRITRAMTLPEPTPACEEEHVLVKMLLVQRWYGLDDAATVEEVTDRISLRRFCGLGLEEAVPDADTLRSFRLRLAGLLDGHAL